MISYAKLWLLLDKRCLTPKALITLAGKSTSTLRMMKNNQSVRLDVLKRICAALSVDIGDVCSFRG